MTLEERITRIETALGLIDADAQPDVSPALSVRAILADVSYHMGLSAADVIGPSRRPAYVRARQAIAWLARRHTDKSLTIIAHAIGDRDRSTIIHAIGEAERRRDAGDPSFRLLTDRLTAQYRRRAMQ